MSCPCKDCICKPKCMILTFKELKDNCTLIFEKHNKPVYKTLYNILEIQKELEPTRWFVSETENDYIINFR